MSPIQVTFNVILVETLYSINIGSTSRAMTNMGADRLILINPQTEVDYSAQQMAATGQGPLQNRTVYSSWKDFFEKEPEGLRISFTAKDGKNRQVRLWTELLEDLKVDHLSRLAHETMAPIPIYLIFGREDWGLSNEDLELSHFNVYLPIYGGNTSLNLSQAVLTSLVLLRDRWGGIITPVEGHVPKTTVNPETTTFPEKELRDFLEEMGMVSEEGSHSAFSVMKRLLLESVPTEREFRVLVTVLKQGIRKLREYNLLRKEKGLPFIDTGKTFSKDEPQT
ncbi:MAG: RNA methyltransferase [Proteobacteria bacterium]|jgi:tRNA/rRNA methyltransferase|nr:RNA methyltransferase [Pseudomonadota bacterium]